MSRTTRRTFLKTSAVTAAAAALPHQTRGNQDSGAFLDGFDIARRHAIVRDIPTPNFFEGMLLGNGDVGVCVTVRPDALGLHLGKEDSWDIRVSEEHYREVLPFDRLLDLWRSAGEEAKRMGKQDMIHLENNIESLRRYNEKVVASYRKPWPRPWPCGTVWIHWDARMVRLARQTLDPSCGLLTVELDCDDLRGQVRRVNLSCFVLWTANHISISTDAEAPFLSVAYYPNREREALLPEPKLGAASQAGSATFSCYQHFPATAPTETEPHPPASPRDRYFRLDGWLAGEWFPEATAQRAFLRSARPQLFRLDLSILTPGKGAGIAPPAKDQDIPRDNRPVSVLRQETEQNWRQFWSRSAVSFEDKELERIWYHNQYFLACCLREGRVAPGLFGNWTSGKIGTAWHGDYHMNYNTQQVFWGVFSSNHPDQHLPYVELCENLLPMAEAFAKEKFGLPGAFFPHSAYPVPSLVVPYPALPWGYEVCETPWTVQSLWWHYLYTQDEAFLRRAYPLIRAATRFLVAYFKPGPDGRYHVVPTVSPENWGCTVDFRLNRDCIMDLALTEFILDAAAEAAKILGVDAEESGRWRELRSRLAPYPQASGPHGSVWLDVPGAPVEFVYNVPVTLAPVFPGEQVGLGLRAPMLELARRTARLVRLEGGNDLVYLPLILARLGMLDLNWFKKEVRYCLLPNGVCNDRVRQIGGRYSDQTDPDFMMRMGVWTENLSLPAVLNECMLQSYSGTIRLFPNGKGLGPARFADLRAIGAFLITAAWDGSKVTSLEILSEKGRTVRLARPWEGTAVQVKRKQDGAAIQVSQEEDSLIFATRPGEAYVVSPLPAAKASQSKPPRTPPSRSARNNLQLKE